MNNNNSCNNDYKIKIYNSVFNNKYLRMIIFNHLTIYNILFNNFDFIEIKFWTLFKYKDYLNSVTFYFEFDLNQLPENIRKVHIFNSQNLPTFKIPNHIESLRVSGLTLESLVKDILPLNENILSKLHRLSLSIGPGESLSRNMLPKSINSLRIENKHQKIELEKNMLPSNLKYLEIKGDIQLTKREIIPSSLNKLKIQTDPLIINQLSSTSLKNLVFDSKRESIFGNKLDVTDNIQFPNSLEVLSVSCDFFNTTKLPDNLKSFSLNCSQINENLKFPTSLEHLHLPFNSLLDIYHPLPPNLKSLESTFLSITDNNNKGQSILPSRLEKLIIHRIFNEILQVNQLPSTLTYLDLGSAYDQVIDVNVLPANLDTLILGYRYSQVINPLAIPQQLKLLEIKNINYSHPINLTPLTHPNVAIKYHDINLYYQATSPDYNQIRVLRLPNIFNLPLSTLQLQNKSNLEYLYLGYNFNKPIELSDLPIQNNIKILELSDFFNKTINLEHFQNLETIVIGNSLPTIITTTSSIIIDGQQHVHYNNYKLKSIIVSPKIIGFLVRLDLNFYQFIKYSNK